MQVRPASDQADSERLAGPGCRGRRDCRRPLGGFFHAPGAEAIREVVDAFESLDQVDGILWMDRAPMLNIFGLPEPILPGQERVAGTLRGGKERELEHPLVGGQLLSPDAKTLLLMVRLIGCTSRRTATAPICSVTRDRDRGPVSRRDDDVSGDRARCRSESAGRPALVPTRCKYQAIGYSIALIIAFILFRGLSSVVIVAMRADVRRVLDARAVAFSGLG